MTHSFFHTSLTTTILVTTFCQICIIYYYFQYQQRTTQQSRYFIVEADHHRGSRVNAEWEAVFKKRRETAAEACRRHVGYDAATFDANKMSSYDIDARRNSFLYYTFSNVQYKFLICTIPKVASTNVKEMLFSLMEKPSLLPNETTVSSWPHIYPLKADQPDDVKLREATYKKIIIVRHPIERLISAWRNKMSMGVPPDYFRIGRIAEHIVENYRLLPESNQTNPVTLSEFFQFLVAEGTGRRMDDVHWRKYVNHCDPCRVAYDYIVHYENLNQELGYVMNVTTGIPNIMSLLPKPANSSFASTMITSNRQSLSDSDASIAISPSLRQAYASSITDKNLLRQLRDAYAVDFDIFGYDEKEK